MITNVYSTIIESAKVAYHWPLDYSAKTTLFYQPPVPDETTCLKRKLDAPNKWVFNIANKAMTQV